MAKQKFNWQKIHRGAVIARWIFWGLILIFVVVGIIQLSLASGSGEPATLDELISYPRIGELVSIVAVVMVIIAGIVYAFDLGGGRQIGVAKEMLTAAIGGVLLFMIGSWLLGEIKDLFPAPPPIADIGGVKIASSQHYFGEPPEENFLHPLN